MLLSIKRALRVLAAIAASFLFYCAFFLLLVWLDSLSATSSTISAIEEWSTVAFFFLGLFVPLPVLFYLRRTRRNVWIREEAERWLAQRAISPHKAHRSVRLRKVLRKVLWIPILLALSIFLFFPESMGLVSHLFYPSTMALNGHRVKPPLTSLVSEFPLLMDVYVGRGIARVGLSPYWHMDPPFSYMGFSAQDPSENSPITYFASETAVLDRTVELGDETISCWRISRSYERAQTGFLILRCRSSKNDFSAAFDGSGKDASVFYNILERSTESK